MEAARAGGGVDDASGAVAGTGVEVETTGGGVDVGDEVTSGKLQAKAARMAKVASSFLWFERIMQY